MLYECYCANEIWYLFEMNDLNRKNLISCTSNFGCTSQYDSIQHFSGSWIEDKNKMGYF